MGKERKQLWRGMSLIFGFSLFLSLMAVNAQAVIGGFEGGDGNLAPDGNEDWNSFTSMTTASDWNFARFPDAIAKDDDQYDGGTKQDKDCPGTHVGSMGGGSTKFDLEEIRLGHKNVGGDEILVMSWIRVPSSPSASSHIAYEFNKGENGTCDPTDNAENPEGLLKRSLGDLLFVFDFEGGEADSTVRVTEWIASGECEVKQSTPPCWGNPRVLTTLGFAEANVNKPSIGDVVDAIPEPDRTLVPVQFGETAINLTAADIFDPETCEGFGFVTGVSRSSGNSGIAQMKDKVGPNKFNLANCGSVLVNKVDHNGDLLDGATIKITPADNVDDGDGIVDEAEIIDASKVTTMVEGDDGVFCTDELPFADYVVFETDAPEGFTPDDAYHSVTVDEFSTCAGRLGDPGTGDDDDPDVTITNNPEPGRVNIEKTDDADNPLPDIQFELFIDDDENGELDETDTSTGRTCTTDDDGVCREDGVSGADRPAFDQVDPGFYCVAEVESTIPPEYSGADPQCFEVTITAGGDTIDLTFVNDRLHKVIVIVCHEGTDTLAESDVDDGDETFTTIGSSDVSDDEEAFLCGLDGFEHEPHGEKDVTVDVGSDAHN